MGAFFFPHSQGLSPQTVAAWKPPRVGGLPPSPSPTQTSLSAALGPGGEGAPAPSPESPRAALGPGKALRLDAIERHPHNGLNGGRVCTGQFHHL